MKLTGNVEQPTSSGPKGNVVLGNNSQGGSTVLPKSRQSRHNDMWLYKWHDTRWAWKEGWGWHPVLAKFHLANGLDNMTVNEKGHTTKGQAVQANLNRGWHIIDLGDPRLGKYANYVQQYPTVKGPIYVSIFDSPEVLGRNVEWHRDEEAYKDFLQTLISNGVIPPMRDMLLRHRIRKQSQVTRRLEEDLYHNPNNPLLRARYERENRKLAGMEGRDVDQAIEQAREMAEQMKAANPDVVPDAPPEVFLCDTCQRSFASEHGLKIHKTRCGGISNG